MRASNLNSANSYPLVSTAVGAHVCASSVVPLLLTRCGPPLSVCFPKMLPVKLFHLAIHWEARTSVPELSGACAHWCFVLRLDWGLWKFCRWLKNIEEHNGAPVSLQHPLDLQLCPGLVNSKILFVAFLSPQFPEADVPEVGEFVFQEQCWAMVQSGSLCSKIQWPAHANESRYGIRMPIY